MDHAFITRLGLHAGVLALLVAAVASARPAPGTTPWPATPPPPAAPASARATPAASPHPASAAKVGATSPLRGTLLDAEISSPTIGKSLPYRVYLPPDYETNPGRHYPVLYMLHGIGGNYTEWSDSFLPERADELIARGEIPPLIIVMPDGSGPTYWANWPDGGPRWADYVANDVVQIIDQRYRTVAAPESRAIGGLSMGGLGALTIALRHPDVFGIVGGHSPSLRLEPDPALWFLVGDNFDQHSPLRLVEERDDAQRLMMWLDVGAEDVWRPNIEAFRSVVERRGLRVRWHVFPGQHESEYWIEHVPDYLRFYAEALRGSDGLGL
jgi:enterochelin esterase-like enzyme